MVRTRPDWRRRRRRSGGPERRERNRNAARQGRGSRSGEGGARPEWRGAVRVVRTRPDGNLSGKRGGRSPTAARQGRSSRGGGGGARPGRGGAPARPGERRSAQLGEGAACSRREERRGRGRAEAGPTPRGERSGAMQVGGRAPLSELKLNTARRRASGLWCPSEN